MNISPPDLASEELAPAPASAVETVESVRVEEPAVRPAPLAGSVASQPSEGEINQFNRPISAPKPRELKVEDALHYLDQVICLYVRSAVD